MFVKVVNTIIFVLLSFLNFGKIHVFLFIHLYFQKRLEMDMYNENISLFYTFSLNVTHLCQFSMWADV